MARDPDPPATAGNPPPFTPNDLRISPSGPYIPGSGVFGLIRLGADSVVQNVSINATTSTFSAVPRSTSPSKPLVVTFPEWTSGDVLWVEWALSGGVDPADVAACDLIVVPTVDVGAGPHFIDNAHVIFSQITGQIGAQAITLSGTAAIKLTNPAQPPLVQLFASLNDGGTNTTQLSIAGVGPSESVGSCWLVAVEVSGSSVFQLPPEVVLSPFT